MKPIDFVTAQPNELLTFENNEEIITLKRSNFYLVDSFLDESENIFRTYSGYIPHCKYAELTLWSEGEKLLLTVVIWHVPFSPLTCPVNWQDEALTRIQGLTVSPNHNLRKSAIYVPYILFSSLNLILNK